MKTSLDKKPVLFFVTILLIAALACGSSVEPTLLATAEPTSDYQDNPGMDLEQNTSQETAVTLQRYNIGDIIEMGDTVLIILGWEEIDGAEFFKPDSGQKFVAVELVIVNKSQSSKTVSTLLQMKLKDETNQQYDVDFGASMAIDGTSVDGELVPGEKIRGQVGFQIPETMMDLEFVFDASIFGTGKLFIDLGGTPYKVDAPAEIPGELNLQSYNVGETIALGTTTLVVNQVTYPPGDQFNRPNPGNIFVVVDITFENKSDVAVSVSSLLQMSLKDADGYKYGVDLMATTASTGSTVDGEVAPGEVIRGQIGFQIPENASGLVFVFDVEVWGSGKAFITLP